MGTEVHPTAVVEEGARLGANVVVGPLCYVGRDVELGEGTRLVAHATVLGPSRLGARNVVHPHAAIGGPPQDKSHHGEPTELVTGDDNVFREQVTVHRGTSKGGGATRIGSRCLLMVGAHVAHDAVLGDGVVMANLASLGGHVVVDDAVVMGGHVAVAPFARIGRMSFLAGAACVERSVPPFVIAAGDRARVRALNVVGLERNGTPAESRAMLERAFRMIWRSGEPMVRGVRACRSELGSDAYVVELLDFLEA